MTSLDESGRLFTREDGVCRTPRALFQNKVGGTPESAFTVERLNNVHFQLQ